MSKFFTVSIGRKFVMSLTGLFLVVFVAIHLGLNLLLIFDKSGKLFNLGAHFMATNPMIKVMEPILGLGFVIHIIWSFFLEYQNWRARPVKFNQRNTSGGSTWASRNMLVLGGMVLVFLVIHIIHFFWKIKFETESIGTVMVDGVEMENAYGLVAGLFKSSLFAGILYVVGSILLGIHLSHGFWSAFHTLGLNNKFWIKRWQVIGKIYAIVIAAGFAIIPLYFIFGLYK